MLQAKKFAWSLLSNENHENDKASSFYAFGKHHIFKLVCSSMNLLKIIVKICYLPSNIIDLFHGGGRYHVETSPLICSAIQWTSFYMITASVMKELKVIKRYCKYSPLAPVERLAIKLVQVATNVFLEKDVLEKSNCN